MAEFSGTALALPSVVGGTMTLSSPTGAANSEAVQTRIREAAAFGVKNTITKSNGYFNDIGEVNVNAVASNSKRNNYPSIDLSWIRERYTNNVQGGNSLGGYNKIASMLIDCHIFAEDCKASPESVVLARERIVADIEKYFGTHFIIPNSLGVGTAFNCIIIGNTTNGIQATEPYGSVEIQLEIYYRILLTDPTQDF